MLELNKTYCGDCRTVVRDWQPEFANMVLCDPPYGVTQNKADIAIPAVELWDVIRRVVKPSGVVVLTSQFPYTIDLIGGNRNWFRYDLVWDKKLVSGFLNAKLMPLRVHEHILIFSQASHTYNPQFTKGSINHSKGLLKNKARNRNYGKFDDIDTKDTSGLKYPNSILSFQKPHPSKALHPTEKSVDLFEYLIRTYSNEGDIVVDLCSGVGTTAVAAERAKRKWVNVEKSPENCKIAQARVDAERAQLKMF